MSTFLWPALLIVEIIMLFRTSRALQGKTLKFLNVLFKPKLGLWVFSLLFFGGTYFHEISHLLAARLLGVRAELSSLRPKRSGNEVIMGSVSLAQTGLFRRFLIGVAPFVLGLTGLIGLVYLLHLHPFESWWQWVLWGYLVFLLGNTMFLSREDMKGAWVFLIPIISLGCGLLFYFGLPAVIISFLKEAALLLLVPLVFNLMGLLLLKA